MHVIQFCRWKSYTEATHSESWEGGLIEAYYIKDIIR
jgi:hypothetical protein